MTIVGPCIPAASSELVDWSSGGISGDDYSTIFIARFDIHLNLISFCLAQVLEQNCAQYD